VTACLFVSDLHGRIERYRTLFTAIAAEAPKAVFLGGDLLPGGMRANRHEAGLSAAFVTDFLGPELALLRDRLDDAYPRFLIILGNDDPCAALGEVEALEREGLWEHLHGRSVPLEGHPVYGYANVPPTPLLLKDWERYDVTRHVDVGCVSPEEGVRTAAVGPHEVRWGTIERDLRALCGDAILDAAVMLFHAPPYRTALDRAALGGRSVDGVPLDPHVGSIAIRRFIEVRQPLLTLHGHVHEAPRLSGAWRDAMGRTIMLSAAHDGPELAVVRFDLETPSAATRELIPAS
jgi:uncharacterized protein